MLKRRTTLNPFGAPDTKLTEELKKCQDDPVYFIENYCKINHPVRGVIPFKLYDYQKDALRDYQNHKLVIQLAARQTSKTSLLTAFVVWFTTFHVNKAVVYTASTTLQAFDCRDRINFIRDHLPSWMSSRAIVNNKREIYLENGCSILYRKPSAHASCGINAALIIGDDYANVDNHDQIEFYAGIIPTIVYQGKLILASTKGPDGCFFNQTLTHARQNPHDSKFHFITWPWHIVPGRDETYASTLKSIMSEEQWRREYLGEFTDEEPSVEPAPRELKHFHDDEEDEDYYGRF